MAVHLDRRRHPVSRARGHRPPARRRSRLLAVVGAASLLLAACDPGNGDEAVDDGDDGAAADDVTAQDIAAAGEDAPTLDDAGDASEFADFGAEGLDRWQEQVPDIEDVTITSTADDSEQPTLWLPPEEDGAPLLVGLHTWSTPYLQHISIPFAQWAQAQGWGFVHPNFRGANDNPEATGSDLAVQDVVDAIDFAIETGGVDADRVYTIGFSGGGMMSLLLAGRHPDRITGAVAWAPNYDLVDWHAYTAEQFPDEDYAAWLEASCGGDPQTDEEAEAECRHRSPLAHLDGAREAGVPIYLAHGLADDLVPPDHAVRPFDQLATEDDRLGDDVAASVRELSLPDDLDGEMGVEPLFGDGDPPVRFSRSSGPVTLVLYEADHELTYAPGLRWIHGLDQVLAGEAGD